MEAVRVLNALVAAGRLERRGTRRRQARATARQFPDEAIAALETLGYSVTAPSVWETSSAPSRTPCPTAAFGRP